ncbi:MAG: TonB-dependent receptor plug domain-containing protein [Bacteroidales bacterium]
MKKPIKILILVISFCFGANSVSGYNDRELIKSPNDSLVLAIDPDSTIVLLNEICVSAGITTIYKSPLRLTNISREEISVKSPGQTFPELLKFNPGVYATSESGSFGEANINIRGFKQENISILLNGLPISGLTSGSMYWNNWAGLVDGTAQIQLQKGIGNSMLADNSVGGTINIITTTPSPDFFLKVGHNITSYSNQKSFLSYNSGTLKHDWSINFTGSYTWGPGQVECTYVRAASYLLSIYKKFNKHNSLLFTVLGSPEKHQQRSARLSYAEVERYGNNYSKNWGYYQNDKRNISKNFYHKPYITLTHTYNDIWKHNINIQWRNTLYGAYGTGGGSWNESTNWGNRIIDHQKAGYIDWYSVYADNKNPTNLGNKCNNIQTDYLAGHIQIGYLSALDLKLNKKFDFQAGLHYQLYNTWEKEQITDMLGGDYWYEDYEHNSLAGLALRNPIKKEGDYIRTNNGRHTNYLTLYLLNNYTSENGKLTLKIGASFSGSTTRRWDKYNYINHIYSDLAKGIGFSIKAGTLYKINNSNSIYLNAAIYNRAPYAKVYFANGNNIISHNVKNQKNYLGEFGYRLVGNVSGLEVTTYIAYWKNKALMSNPYQPLDNEPYRYMVTGLNALHYGLEINAFYNLSNQVRISAYGALSENKWKNDVSANIYDPYTGQINQTVNVYSDGLHVGDSPQTQIGGKIIYSPLIGLSFENDLVYNDRFWADFDPASRTNINDKSDSYRIPGYFLLNFHAKWHKPFKKNAMTLFLNINNVTESHYVERGKDGTNHNRESFRGYWGAYRNFNIGINFRF